MPVLSGIRVVDLGGEPARFASDLLVQLGAEVLHGAAGERALAEADAVVLTGSPLGLSRRDLEPNALLARYPRLIAVVISPFGLAGPRAEWRASDTIAQSMGGMVFVNGHADEPPLRAMGAQAYHCAGLQAVIGLVLALLDRRRSGRGQLVDVSLHESTVAALEHVTGLFRERGVIAARQGTLHWSSSFSVAECRDGPVLLSLLGDWTALVEWMKADGAVQDLDQPHWADSARRRAECAYVFAVLAAWAARYRVDELVEQAQLRRLPFAPVWPLGRVVEHPQLWARGFLERTPHGVAMRRGGPFRFTGCAPSEGEGRPDPAGRSIGEVGGDAKRGGTGVLRGVRVLDFTWVVAGPVATRVLADHGADVIKIERLDTPDGPERRGGLFGNLNRGKRSLAIDLGDARGRALVRELARRCDVVVDNFSPRVMANWGLDPEALRALDSGLVVLSMSGFGATGPYANHVSYGPTLQAQTGFTWHMRHPDRAPAGWGFSYSDMVSGYCGALAVLAALWQRAATGTGCSIDLAQLEVLAAMIDPPLVAAAERGDAVDALGNRSPERAAAPDGVFRCRDDVHGRERWCAMTIDGDDEWRRFVDAVGAPAWTRAPRFATRAGRLANAVDLERQVESWTRAHEAETIAQMLQAAGLAAGLVADASDLAADPQLAARRYWITLPEGVVLDGVVPRLSATPGGVTAGGPRLGEHTDEVLRDLLGMEQSAVAALRVEGIVR